MRYTVMLFAPERVSPGIALLLALTVGGLLCSEATAAQEYPVRLMVQFGVFDGPGAIGSVAGLTLDGQGHVYVADGLAGQILKFSVDGEYVGALGRKGPGPGEFLGLGAIGWRSGGLWAYDVRQQRITAYSADHSVVRTLTFSSRTFGPTATGVGGIGPYGDAYVALGLYQSGLVARGLVQHRPIFLIDDAGLVFDTLARIPVERETSSISRSDSESPLYFSELVKASPIVALSPDGHRLLVVERPAPDTPVGRFRLQVYEAGKGRILDRWISVRTTPLTEDWIDSRLDPIFDEGRLSLISRRLLEDNMWKPDYHPPVSWARIGSDGSIWIAREATDSVTLGWEVFDLNGILQFTTRLPADLRVHWVDRSQVWGSRPGQLDVPRIEAYRIGP